MQASPALLASWRDTSAPLHEDLRRSLIPFLGAVAPENREAVGRVVVRLADEMVRVELPPQGFVDVVFLMPSLAGFALQEARHVVRPAIAHLIGEGRAPGIRLVELSPPGPPDRRSRRPAPTFGVDPVVVLLDGYLSQWIDQCDSWVPAVRQASKAGLPVIYSASGEHRAAISHFFEALEALPETTHARCACASVYMGNLIRFIEGFNGPLDQGAGCIGLPQGDDVHLGGGYVLNTLDRRIYRSSSFDIGSVRSSFPESPSLPEYLWPISLAVDPPTLPERWQWARAVIQWLTDVSTPSFPKPVGHAP